MAEEIIGKSIKVLIPPEHQEEENTIIERIRRGQRVEHYETIRRRKHGSLINVSLSISPVKNAQGRTIGASKIARDITGRKRSEAQITILAREAEHRAKNLSATVQATVSLSQSDTPEGLKHAIEGRSHERPPALRRNALGWCRYSEFDQGGACAVHPRRWRAGAD
jgi:PAS domain